MSIYLDYDYVANSTMPSGLKQQQLFTANNNSIFLRGYDDDTEGLLVPFTHPKMRVHRYYEKNYVYGITRTFNKTTNIDVTPYIIKVSQDGYVTFNANYVSNNDVIEMTYYVTYKDIKSDDEGIDTITQEWVEQWYRHASNLDRTDFGNYDPPFDHAWEKADPFSRGHSSVKYTYHPRLFFTHNGFIHEDTRHSGVTYSCGPITKSLSTILQWSIFDPHTVGTFIGDPSLYAVRETNTNYSVAPVPLYITDITFWCKINNSSFDADDGTAVKLNMNIDGMGNAVGVGPRFYDNDNSVYPIINAFGADYDLWMGFSDEPYYSGLSPEYGEIDTYNGSNTYRRSKKILGLCRVNDGLTVNAQTVGLSEYGDSLDEWYLTIGGWIPKTW